MAVDRVRLAGALATIVADPAATADFPERLCTACADALPVDGVGLSLMTEDRPTSSRALLGASDEIGAQIEELQFALGEGPCVSAFTDARPVLIPDMLDVDACARWPVFAREAQAVGVGALFAFPLMVGVLGIGVLDCYRIRAGPLDATPEALAVTDAVMMALIGLKVGSEREFDLFALSSHTHAVVHQAVGALAAKHRMPVTDVLARLRGYAFRHARPLEVVAKDVLGRRLDVLQEED
jgi:hypothetical protein